MTITEAAACGTPAVANRIPGYVDAVVDGRTGLLVAPGELAPAIGLLLSDAGLRERLGEAAAAAQAGLAHLGEDGPRHPAGPGRRRSPAPTGMIATVDEVDVEIEAGPVERRWWIWAQHAFLAVVTYTCMLATAPGYVAADTKAYLYLDPGRLLSRAWSLWDPNVALGTVTHQNIGYLWPMGPWFWAFDRLGVPMWVAQRLWTATLLYLAGAGVLYLVRTLGWGRIQPAAALAAASIYAFSPYVLDYAARISVLLLPWAGLPWLVGLTHRALRDRSWLYPALMSALVVATIGGTNATSILLVGLGPLLWVLFAVFVHREVKAADALVAVLKIGVLSLVVSLWWIAGLVVQGSYGLDVLRYTESVETVARSSTRLRGAPRPRLLVLLRHRQARPLDRARTHVHPVPPADRHRLRAGHPGGARRRHDPLAASGRGGGAHRGRDRRGRRCLSVRPSGAPGPGDQGLRYLLDHRPRPAEHRPGRTARLPRHRSRDRGRAECAWPGDSLAGAGSSPFRSSAWPC